MAGESLSRGRNLAQHLLVQVGACWGKAAEDHLCHSVRCVRDRRCDRNPRRPLGGKAVDTGGDGGKSDGVKIVRGRKLHGAAVAGRQCCVLAAITTMPDRPYRMDDVTGRQPITFGNLGVAGGAAA